MFRRFGESVHDTMICYGKSLVPEGNSRIDDVSDLGDPVKSTHLRVAVKLHPLFGRKILSFFGI